MLKGLTGLQSGLNYPGGGAIPVPAGFTWTPAWSIFQVRPGYFATNINEASLKPATGRTLYVDVATGNNANAGTNPLLPKKQIWHAINTGGNDTIYVKQGVYDGLDGIFGITPVQNTCLIGVTDFTSLAPGRVVISRTGGINGILNVNVTYYMQNITFVGGTGRCFLLQNGSVVAIDCDFVSPDTLESFAVTANAAGITHNVTLIRCRSINAKYDGFTSTCSAAGEVLRWAEIDCVSYRSGRAGAGTHQGSSVHKVAGNGAINVIRINGHYYDSYGPQNIADVGGTVSWNLGVHCYRTDAGNNAAFYCGDASTMWLHSCWADGAVPFQTDAAGGTIKVYDTVGTHTGPGTFTTYTGI